MEENELPKLLFLWFVTIAPLIYFVFRKPAAGLVAAYAFQMWMFHWLGALVHAFPWSGLDETDTVVLGFEQATWGIASFAAGALLLGPVLSRIILRKKALEAQGELSGKAPRQYILAGIVAYFILAPTIGKMPGLNAIPAVAAQLVVVGCCLRCWLAWQTSGMPGLIRKFLPTLAIPIVILVRQGFLGFGVIALSIIVLFTSQFFRPRWILAVGFVVCAYLGMSLYVSYMRDRVEIRASVWGGEGLSERLDVAKHTFSNIDWFDPTNENQLEVVDARMNQNLLIGSAVNNLSGSDNFLNGSTFVDAALAMIPRIIWPSKPIRAGSGDLVSDLTGIEFAKGTSVGVGPVLEFYGNFGVKGVIFGFLFLGAVIGALDQAAGKCLLAANWPGFMSYFLIGISFMNVSGQLLEVTAGAAASYVVARLVNRALNVAGTPKAPAPDSDTPGPPLEVAA